MKTAKNILNSTLLTASLSIIGIATIAIVLGYVYSVAQPVVDKTIITLAGVLGYGSVALSLVVVLCAMAIILAVSGRLVGGQWFRFVIDRSAARKAILESDFELRVLEKNQQAFLFAKPDSQFIGRNVSLETEPFTPLSLPSNNLASLVKWHTLNAAAPTRQVNDGVPMLETQEDNAIRFEQIAREALSSRDTGRFIVFGSMGCGKTTLAKHTLDYAIAEIAHKRGGDVYVIDPHSPRIIWNDDVKVIGAGLDYQSIANFLNWLITDVRERYELGCGDGGP